MNDRSRTVRNALLIAALASLPVAASATTTTPKRATGYTAAGKAAMVLPFIEDDYSRAIAEAKARKVPIFVESWAPW